MTNETYTTGEVRWYASTDLDAMQKTLDLARERERWQKRLLDIEKDQHLKTRERYAETVRALKQEIEELYDFIEALNVALSEALGNPVPWNGPK